MFEDLTDYDVRVQSYEFHMQNPSHCPEEIYNFLTGGSAELMWVATIDPYRVQVRESEGGDTILQVFASGDSFPIGEIVIPVTRASCDQL